jgi:hypothetical protein
MVGIFIVVGIYALIHFAVEGSPTERQGNPEPLQRSTDRQGNPDPIERSSETWENPEYASWARFSVGAWRTCRLVTATVSREYREVLLEVTPTHVFFERSVQDQKWTIKVPARFSGRRESPAERIEGDGAIILTVAGQDIATQWESTQTLDWWEQVWKSPEVPGGWVKRSYGTPGTETHWEETVTEWKSP